MKVSKILGQKPNTPIRPSHLPSFQNHWRTPNLLCFFRSPNLPVPERCRKFFEKIPGKYQLNCSIILENYMWY